MTKDGEKHCTPIALDQPSRRAVLGSSAGAALWLVAGGCGVRLTQGTFPLGEPASFIIGQATLEEGGPFIVVRDEGGIYAMSARCTHLGCQVDIAGDSLACPCHGTVFDLHGQVTDGPARRGLDHFKVTLVDGRVTVDTREVVAPTERLAVSI